MLQWKPPLQVSFYVDMYSAYTFINLQTKWASEETFRAKMAFKAQKKSFSISVLQYHAENGRFQVSALHGYIGYQPSLLTWL